MTFVSYQVVNAFCFIFNLTSKALPSITFSTLWISILSYVTIILAVPIASPEHKSASCQSSLSP